MLVGPTASKQISSLLWPPKIDTTNIASVLAAMNRQRIARIVRTVAYVFATITTTAAVVMTEAAVMTLPIAAATLSIAVIAWVVFWWINRQDDDFLSGINDQTLENLATKELNTLFLVRTLDSFQDDKALKLAFEAINQLLASEIISIQLIEKLMAIKKGSNGTKTILESANKLNISLDFSSKKNTLERGWFGREPTAKQIEVRWEGKNKEPIHISIHRPSSSERG